MSLSHSFGWVVAALVAVAPCQDPQDKPAQPAQQSPAPQKPKTDPAKTKPPARSEALLVLVNAKNPTTSLNMGELRSYFKKERRFWPNGRT